MDIKSIIKNVTRKAVKSIPRKPFRDIVTAVPGLKDHLPLNVKLALRTKLTGEEFNEYTLHGIYPKIYSEYAAAPVDENKVVFIEVRLPEITNSFKFMYDTIANNYDYDIHTHFLRNSFVSRKEYRRRCTEMIKDVATAKYVFLNEASNVIGCLPLRPETKVIQLWHGCGAFKKFGMSTADLIFGGSREAQLRFPFYKNFFLVTVSSPEVEWAYEEAMCYEHESGVVKALGSSRTDVFYDEKFIADSKQRLYSLMPAAKGKKVILYAPTFRGRVANGQMPDMLDVRMFKEALGDEYVLIFKHHPLVKKPPVIDTEYSDFAVDFTTVMSIEELLCVSDICISDYSSLVFEYSLFEKPLIFYAFDIDEYNDWRGFYYDYNELTPGPVFKTNTQMIEYIKNIDTLFDKEQVHAFREKFMSSCDGHATQRILDYAFGIEELKAHEKKVKGEFIEYHRIPKVNQSGITNLQKALDNAQSRKQRAQNIYRGECALNDIDPNRITYITEKPTIGAKLLISKLSKSGYVVSVFKQGYTYAEVLKSVAMSKVVIIDSPVRVIGLIDLRPGTTVIQLWKYAVPVQHFASTSLNMLDGQTKKINDVLTPYRNYDYIPVASEYQKNCYRESFDVEDDACFADVGSVHTDIFFNKTEIASIKKRLNAVLPDSQKGKKIVFYYPKPRKNQLSAEKEYIFVDIKYLHEYLGDEYVVLYLYPKKKAKALKNNEYYKDFAINLAFYPIAFEGDSETDSAAYAEYLSKRESFKKFYAEELMAVADVVIGDFMPETLNFLATGKPMFFYAPDVSMQYSIERGYLPYHEFTGGMLYSDSLALAKAIKDIDNSYDYGRLNELKETYCPNCDGKAAKRIVEYIKSL